MAEPRKTHLSFLSKPEFGVLISTLVIGLVFAVLSPRFLRVSTFGSMMTVAGELGVTTLGVAFLMISGEFDLSVGSVYAIAPMTVALLAQMGVDPFVGALAALGLAVVIGLTNGYVTLKAGIPSFITTLGMMMFLRGVLLAITGGFPVRYEKEHWFLTAMNGHLAYDFRTSAIWLIVLTIVFAFVLENTRWGNWTYAAGANPGVARELGINVFRVKVVNFVVSSTMAALAGIMSFSRFHVVDPTLGVGLELDAIAAAVVGGCLLTGGYGSMVGSFLGVMLIAMLYVGLVLVGAPAYWYRAFIGLILIVATVINMTVVKRLVMRG